MTSTGAKGSNVNFSQITGHARPAGARGSTRAPLDERQDPPCFQRHDTARARGYITDRFLTGVRPPEFYFHCMAGREGLVDTAVKTSRSGYLQRCLIKHLEALRSRTITRCARRPTAPSSSSSPARTASTSPSRASSSAPEFSRATRNSCAWNLERAEAGGGGAQVARRGFAGCETGSAGDGAEAAAPPPLWAPSPGGALGVVSGGLRRKDPGPEDFSPRKAPPRPPPAAAAAETREKIQEEQEGRGVQGRSLARGGGAAAAAEEFKRPTTCGALAQVLWRRPGEASGCVAAQSVGEPSTQMTLNTFPSPVAARRT